MSFINDLAFGEKLDELEIEGDLKVGGDILLQGAFPKMDQKIFDLNTTIGYKANQSDVDEMEVTLNTKANQVDVDASLSLGSSLCKCCGEENHIISFFGVTLRSTHGRHRR